MSVRFLHGADFHLGRPCAGIARRLPEWKERLQRAPLTAYENFIKLAIREKVDFVVLSGDVFDDAEPGLLVMLAFRDGMRRLDEAGIHCFIAPGNHDPLPLWSKLELPDNSEVFGKELTSYRIGDALVSGIAHTRAAETRNLAREFAGIPRSELFQVAVLHGNVTGAGSQEAYAPVELAELAGMAQIDYWALGHIHKRQVLRDARPAVAYSGVLQGTHVNEPDAGGCWLVTLRPGVPAETEFRVCDDVRFFRRELQVGVAVKNDGLLSQISELGQEIRRESDGRLGIVELKLTGGCALNDDLRRQNPDELSTVCGGALGKEVQLASLCLETAGLLDREGLLRRNRLAAEIARLGEISRAAGLPALCAEADKLQRTIPQMEPFSASELARIADGAEEELLRLLSGGGGA